MSKTKETQSPLEKATIKMQELDLSRKDMLALINIMGQLDMDSYRQAMEHATYLIKEDI